MSSLVQGWHPFFASVFLFQYNVGAYCPGIRSVPVVQVSGRCRSSRDEVGACRPVREVGACHPVCKVGAWRPVSEVGACRPGRRSVLFFPELGRCLLSRYEDGAIFSVFVPVRDWGLSSGVSSAPFPSCSSRYLVVAFLRILVQRHLLSFRPGIRRVPFVWC